MRMTNIENNLSVSDWQSMPDWVSFSGHWFVLTDTHGRFDAMMQLFKYFPSGARLVHLGDIGDRGKQNIACYEFFATQAKNGAILLSGNHDLFVYDSLFRTDISRKCIEFIQNVWMANGGFQFFQEMKKNKGEKIVKEVLQLQIPSFQDGNLHFFHSGLRPEDDFSLLKDKILVDEEDLNERRLNDAFHLAWRGGDEIFMYSQEAEWSGFDTKPFFIHGHRRADRSHAIDVPCHARPAFDSWRLCVDRRGGMAALEIKNGAYRFFELEKADFQ